MIFLTANKDSLTNILEKLIDFYDNINGSHYVKSTDVVIIYIGEKHQNDLSSRNPRRKLFEGNN